MSTLPIRANPAPEDPVTINIISSADYRDRRPRRIESLARRFDYRHPSGQCRSRIPGKIRSPRNGPFRESRRYRGMPPGPGLACARILRYREGPGRSEMVARVCVECGVTPLGAEEACRICGGLVPPRAWRDDAGGETVVLPSGLLGPRADDATGVPGGVAVGDLLRVVFD